MVAPKWVGLVGDRRVPTSTIELKCVDQCGNAHSRTGVRPHAVNTGGHLAGEPRREVDRPQAFKSDFDARCGKAISCSCSCARSRCSPERCSNGDHRPRLVMSAAANTAPSPGSGKKTVRGRKPGSVLRSPRPKTPATMASTAKMKASFSL